MVGVKFFLDTGALIALSGLEGSDSQVFKNRIEASNSRLSITHIQIDESYNKELKNYQQKIKKALESLKNKGIEVQPIECTKIGVFSESRFGLARFGDEEIGNLYDELRNEIDQCEKDKGRTKTPSNVARDAIIAVSSIGHDCFITCDKCLFESWQNVVNKRKMLRKNQVPRVIYVQPNPKEVAEKMLKFL